MEVTRQTTTVYTLTNVNQEQYDVIYNALKYMYSHNANANVRIIQELLDLMR